MTYNFGDLADISDVGFINNVIYQINGYTDNSINTDSLINAARNFHYIPSIGVQAGPYYGDVMEAIFDRTTDVPPGDVEHIPLTTAIVQALIRTDVLTDAEFEGSLSFELNAGSINGVFTIVNVPPNTESRTIVARELVKETCEIDYEILLDNNPILMPTSNLLVNNLRGDTDYTSRSTLVQNALSTYFNKEYISASEIVEYLEWSSAQTDKNKLQKRVLSILRANPTVMLRGTGIPIFGTITQSVEQWETLINSQLDSGQANPLDEFINAPEEPRVEQLDKKLGQILLWTISGISIEDIITSNNTNLVKDITFDFSKYPLGDFLYGISLEYTILKKLVLKTPSEIDDYFASIEQYTQFSSILRVSQNSLYGFQSTGLTMQEIKDIHLELSLPFEQDYIDKYNELSDAGVVEPFIGQNQNMDVFYENYWVAFKELQASGNNALTLVKLREIRKEMIYKHSVLAEEYPYIYKRLKKRISEGFSGTIFTQLLFYPDTLGGWVLDSFMDLGKEQDTPDPNYLYPEPEPEPEQPLNYSDINLVWTIIKNSTNDGFIFSNDIDSETYEYQYSNQNTIFDIVKVGDTLISGNSNTILIFNLNMPDFSIITPNDEKVITPEYLNQDITLQTIQNQTSTTDLVIVTIRPGPIIEPEPEPEPEPEL